MAVLRSFLICIWLGVTFFGRLATSFQPVPTKFTVSSSAAKSVPVWQPKIQQQQLPFRAVPMRLQQPLNLKAPKKTKSEEEKVNQDWDLSLFFVYMTPWKNPNSIFVYMLLILYGLGKYSESMVVARDAMGGP